MNIEFMLNGSSVLPVVLVINGVIWSFVALESARAFFRKSSRKSVKASRPQADPFQDTKLAAAKNTAAFSADLSSVAKVAPAVVAPPGMTGPALAFAFSAWRDGRISDESEFLEMIEQFDAQDEVSIALAEAEQQAVVAEPLPATEQALETNQQQETAEVIAFEVTTASEEPSFQPISETSDQEALVLTAPNISNENAPAATEPISGDFEFVTSARSDEKILSRTSFEVQESHEEPRIETSVDFALDQILGENLFGRYDFYPSETVIETEDSTLFGSPMPKATWRSIFAAAIGGLWSLIYRPRQQAAISTITITGLSSETHPKESGHDHQLFTSKLSEETILGDEVTDINVGELSFVESAIVVPSVETLNHADFSSSMGIQRHVLPLNSGKLTVALDELSGQLSPDSRTLILTNLETTQGPLSIETFYAGVDVVTNFHQAQFAGAQAITDQIQTWQQSYDKVIWISEQDSVWTFPISGATASDGSELGGSL